MTCIASNLKPPCLAFVAIGRNEGERLKRCLLSIRDLTDTVIYIDSGSTDGSREFAASLGVEVLDLDTTSGFTMSRARNAGWRRALEIFPETEFVHFIDGDCELAEGWLAEAVDFLNKHPDISAVCGRRRERFPHQSFYNRLIDIEWNTAVGEAESSGGDALMRLDALEEVRGFNEALIAGEEPELCKRMRDKGWKIWRLDRDMTWHDANMHTFSQWWKRHVRGGYGARDVALRSLETGTSGSAVLFGHQVRSSLLWTLGTSLVLIAGVAASLISGCFYLFPTILAVLICIWLCQSVRIGVALRKRAGGIILGTLYGCSLMLAKWPQLLGSLKHHADLRTGRTAKLIEYKQ